MILAPCFYVPLHLLALESCKDLLGPVGWQLCASYR